MFWHLWHVSKSNTYLSRFVSFCRSAWSVRLICFDPFRGFLGRVSNVKFPANQLLQHHASFSQTLVEKKTEKANFSLLILDLCSACDAAELWTVTRGVQSSGEEACWCRGLVCRHGVSVQVSCNRCLLRSASRLSVGSNPPQSTCSLSAINGSRDNKLRLPPKTINDGMKWQRHPSTKELVLTSQN